MSGPNIFGADIAGKILKGLGPLVFDVTLKSTTQGARGVALTGGTNPSSVDYTVKGFVSDYTEYQIDGTIIQKGDRVVVILGASLPDGVIPKPDDQVVAEGKTGVVINVTRDPAGATYQCQWR